ISFPVAIARGRGIVRDEVLKWAPAIGFPVLIAIFSPNLLPWVRMWVLAAVLFVGAKWITIAPFLFSQRKINGDRVLAYLLLWPGMDAQAFFAKAFVPMPGIHEWI